MAQKRAGGETVLPHKMMGWMSQFFQPWNYLLILNFPHDTLSLSSDSTYWTTIIPQTEHSKQKMIAQSQGYICLWW